MIDARGPKPTTPGKRNPDIKIGSRVRVEPSALNKNHKGLSSVQGMTGEVINRASDCGGLATIALDGGEHALIWFVDLEII